MRTLHSFPLPFSLSGFLPRSLRALPLAALLAACGGGGGDDLPAAPQTPPPEPPTHSQPITEMPSSSYTRDKLDVFVRLNQARLAAGVSAVEQNAQLDAAAQAHATYQVQNYETGHGEDPGKPWFTGVDAVARARGQGYSNTVVNEVIAYVAPQDAVEAFLLSVYHLHGALDPRANQVGIGIDRKTEPSLSSTSLTLGTSGNGLLTAGSFWHWPAHQQINVNPRFIPASEAPNPAPDLTSAGTPIMFCGTEGNFAPLKGVRATIREHGAEASTPARILANARVQVESTPGTDVVLDPNLSPDSIYQGCIFLLPTTELHAGAIYSIDIQATQGGVDISTSWSFETRQADPMP